MINSLVKLVRFMEIGDIETLTKVTNLAGRFLSTGMRESQIRPAIVE